MKTTQLLTIVLATAALSPHAIAAARTIPFRISADAPLTAKKAKYDYSNYARIPDTPTCRTYRLVLRAIPYTRKNAYRGNYAGSGCFGGRPIDAMDDIFRRHDIAYAEARTVQTMRWADAACVEALYKLDAGRLSPDAIEFRNRSAVFFSQGTRPRRQTGDVRLPADRSAGLPVSVRK